MIKTVSFILALVCVPTGLSAPATAADRAPNPYCISGAHWAPSGLMVKLRMPGGIDDRNGCLGYNWGQFHEHSLVSLTNPSWRWTTFDRKPPFHSYDVEKDAIIDPEATSKWILEHPGKIYIIGNEPDNKQLDAGDGVTPEQYARMYHLYHTFIKKNDPTATVAIAGQFSASYPAELKADFAWWDQVLGYYKKTFGQDMPIDIWNCHCYTHVGDLDAERIVREFFIPYRAYVDTVSGGIYADKPFWCTEFGVALWASPFAPEYMAEFVQQLCPRLEKEYKLPTGKTKRVIDRFFWFLGPYAEDWKDSALLGKDKEPTVIGKAYSQLANGYPNPIPPPPRDPRPAPRPVRSNFDKKAFPWRPMGGDWMIDNGVYRQTRVDGKWGTRSHLPFWYTDFSIECDVKINQAVNPDHWIGVNFRHSTVWKGGIKGYLAYIRQNGEVGLTSNEDGVVAKVPDAVDDASTWHRLAVSVAGPHIEVSVDGKTLIRWDDPKNRYPAGLVSLITGKTDGSFDNVLVTNTAPDKER